MSHIDSGFAITNPDILRQVIEDTCPDLELVAASRGKYRTWVTDHGRLAGDYPLPGVYQMVLLNDLRKAGVDIFKLCQDAGYMLPEENWTEMEHKPWNLEIQRKLMKNELFSAAYHRLEVTVLSQDAEYVIRHKTNRNMYEIGLIQHPIHGHHIMMADWFNDGQGLFNCKGLGRVVTRNGSTEWGNTLKQNYATAVAENTIQQGIATGEYLSYSKEITPAGVVEFNIITRN